ncbi:hypothetical protein SH668x_003265 [Planctomicrobium sp. SH668]|uniref:hypothetical protein n=1 Tax=Planctomicrobium sp. SH668 TaxID=3448126 RepID=UPI003F5C238C
MVVTTFSILAVLLMFLVFLLVVIGLTVVALAASGSSVKKPAMVVGSALIFLLVGGSIASFAFVILRERSVSRVTQHATVIPDAIEYGSSYSHSEIPLIAEKIVDRPVAPIERGNIAINDNADAEELQEPQPVESGSAEPDQSRVKVIEVNYDEGEVTRTVEGIASDTSLFPLWTSENSSIPSLHTPSFILHSGRYATIHEAQHDLESQLRKHIADLFPHLKPHEVRLPKTQELMAREHFLDRLCIVQSKMQVGEFEENIYQVMWKGSVPKHFLEQVERTFVRKERRGKVFVVAGALGLATVIMGIGAMLTRERRVHA